MVEEKMLMTFLCKATPTNYTGDSAEELHNVIIMAKGSHPAQSIPGFRILQARRCASQ